MSRKYPAQIPLHAPLPCIPTEQERNKHRDGKKEPRGCEVLDNSMMNEYEVNYDIHRGLN